jgi:DNA-binding MarR family transcriptional regulator
MTMTQQNLGRLLLERFRWFDESLRALLAAEGRPTLTHAHSMVFATIDTDGTGQAELARRIGVTRQAVHQSVSELADLGLVTLTPDPADGRAKIVELTQAGRANVAAAIATFARIEEELAARIGREAIDGLRAALVAEWGDPLP